MQIIMSNWWQQKFMESTSKYSKNISDSFIIDCRCSNFEHVPVFKEVFVMENDREIERVQETVISAKVHLQFRSPPFL